MTISQRRTYEGDRIMETQEGKHPELKDVEILSTLQIFSSVMSDITMVQAHFNRIFGIQIHQW